MNRSVKIGIIGCGGIANGKHLPALAKIKEVKLVAFCDIIPERAKEVAEKYGAQGAKTYGDYRELLQNNDVEVIHVLTPNNSHCEISVAALESGRHVMCEKPMAKSYADANRMFEAAKKSGKLLTIGYQNRYRPDSLLLKSMCERGDLGDIYFAKAHAIRRRAVPNWGVFLDEEQQGGGPLIDIGTHALDLTLWMMNNYRPKCVMGSSYKKLGGNPDGGNAFGPWNPKEFTVEDSAFGFVTMENGATIIIESSWALNTLDNGEAKTTLCGTKAGADMRDGLRINGDDLGKLYIKTPALSSAGVEFYSGEKYDAADLEARGWIDAILLGKPLTVLPEQALTVTRVLEGIYESAKTGQLVTFK